MTPINPSPLSVRLDPELMRSPPLCHLVRPSFLAVALLPFSLMLFGCEQDQPALSPPTASEVAEHFEYAGELTVEMSGNVAQVTVEIDREAYRRGGDLWAMASPYIFLFSSATRDAFMAHTGLGGVRVVVRYPNGTLLAQALLERSELNELTWQRALTVAGRARSEGTERPGYMFDLVSYGEEHTEFEYNPDEIDMDR